MITTRNLEIATHGCDSFWPVATHGCDSQSHGCDSVILVATHGFDSKPWVATHGYE